MTGFKQKIYIVIFDECRISIINQGEDSSLIQGMIGL
jgi:hypothetical protein